MIDKERAIKIARKTFGLTLTSMPDELYRLINDAVEDERERLLAQLDAPVESEGGEL